MRRSKANWYVLRVRRGNESAVALHLDSQLNQTGSEQGDTSSTAKLSGKYRIMALRREFFYRKDGVEEYQIRPSFPEHVFILTEADAKTVRRELRRFLTDDARVFGFLHYGDDRDDMALSDSDKAILSAVYDEDFIAWALEAVQVGDWVEITDEFFVGHKGIVKRMSRSKRHVTVELDFFGTKRTEDFALRIVEPADG